MFAVDYDTIPYVLCTYANIKYRTSSAFNTTKIMSYNSRVHTDDDKLTAKECGGLSDIMQRRNVAANLKELNISCTHVYSNYFLRVRKRLDSIDFHNVSDHLLVVLMA